MPANTGITAGEIRNHTLTDLQISALAAILESKVLFNLISGHHHDGADSRLISGASATPYVVDSSFTGAINGINTIYTLPQTYVANSSSLYIDGLRQKRTIDYNESSTTTITTTTPPATGARLVIDYLP